MAHRKAVPVIPFDFELDTTTLEYVKHQLKVRAQDGSEDTIEDKIPKLREDASPYEILHFLSTFQRVRHTMNWTTGTKLAQKFPMHLIGYHLDTWEVLMGNRNATVNNFELSLNEFKQELLEGYTYEDQIDYLRTLKKPGKMEPSQFLLKLQAAN